MRKHRTGPFDVNIRDISHKPGQMRTMELDVVAPEKWGEGLVAVQAGESIQVDARAESVHEGILITATAHSRYIGTCGRCLADVAEPVEVEFVELFAYPGGEATDLEVQDDHVDLEILVRDAIVLSLPFQPVCQPDCPGLDPDTGEPLTEAPSAAQPIDPRWSALQDYTTDKD